MSGKISTCLLNCASQDGGTRLTVTPEFVWKMSNDVRAIGEKLINISRLLHEHTHKLEVAVEATYASDGSDPRVRLLADTLNMSRRADMELGYLSRSLQNVLQLLQSQRSRETPVPPS